MTNRIIVHIVCEHFFFAGLLVSFEAQTRVGCEGEDDDPIYVSGLPATYYGALLDESSG